MNNISFVGITLILSGSCFSGAWLWMKAFRAIVERFTRSRLTTDDEFGAMFLYAVIYGTALYFIGRAA